MDSRRWFDRMVPMADVVLSLLLITLALAQVLHVIPMQLRALSAASERYEKIHRLCIAASGALIVQGVAVAYGSVGTSARLLVLLASLCAGLLLFGIAGCFGHVDENGTWHRALWLE